MQLYLCFRYVFLEIKDFLLEPFQLKTCWHLFLQVLHFSVILANCIIKKDCTFVNLCYMFGTWWLLQNISNIAHLKQFFPGWSSSVSILNGLVCLCNSICQYWRPVHSVFSETQSNGLTCCLLPQCNRLTEERDEAQRQLKHIKRG